MFTVKSTYTRAESQAKARKYYTSVYIAIHHALQAIIQALFYMGLDSDVIDLNGN